MAKKLRIAIVGAGPAGLAASLYLHRAQHHVTVFERFEQPAPVGSGLILQPTGLTVLADLGLFSTIQTLGARIDRLFGDDARTERTVLDVRYDALKKLRYGIAVHRAALFDVLHRTAVTAGIEIATGADITDCDPGALIDAKGQRSAGFDLVVDASGSRSKLRRRARGAVEPKPLAYGAFWASLPWRDAPFDRNALTQRYSRASVMIGVLPIGRPNPTLAPMAAFFWSLRPDDADRVRQAGLASWKERLFALWPECEVFLDQIESFDQLTLARYGHHTLPYPAGDRLAVIGDAAHSTSPQLGQGANMALLDAAALNYALDQAPTVPDALDLYCRSRRRHMRLFQALSYLFTPFYQSDSVLLPFVRDRLVSTLANIPPAPQFLAAMVAGTLVDPFAPIGLKEIDFAAHGTIPAPAAVDTAA